MVRVLFVGLVLGFALGAQARPCVNLVDESLRYARDPHTLLRDQAQLRRFARFVARHADSVFIDPDQALVSTAATTLRSRLILPGVSCEGPEGDADLSTSVGAVGLYGAVAHRPSALKLQVFALGRLDTAVLTEDQIDHGTNLISGLWGVNLQLGPWIALGLSHSGRKILQSVAAKSGGQPEAERGQAWIFELGVPRLDLRARVFKDGSSFNLSELARLRIPLAEVLEGALRAEALRLEDRYTLTPKLTYRLHRGAGMTLNFGLETALESDPINLRWLRLSLENTLLESKITRESWRKFGVHIEQRAALTAYRGHQMQQSSGTDTAYGLEWRVFMGMQTQYIYLFFDFGFSFNQPEMLDLQPHASEQGMLAMGMNLAHRW